MNMNINNNSNINNNMDLPFNENNTSKKDQTLSNNEFCLYFKYKGKEGYLDCDPDEPFNNILSKFFRKYENFRKIKIKRLVNNGKVLSDLNKSCNDYKIKSESTIFLID